MNGFEVKGLKLKVSSYTDHAPAPSKGDYDLDDDTAN